MSNSNARCRFLALSSFRNTSLNSSLRKASTSTNPHSPNRSNSAASMASSLSESLMTTKGTQLHLAQKVIILAATGKMIRLFPPKVLKQQDILQNTLFPLLGIVPLSSHKLHAILHSVIIHSSPLDVWALRRRLMKCQV
eukprot:5917872-Amphidinium_carterae.1